jgi:hypothetical protein
LSDADLRDIFELSRFWERVLRQSNHGLLGMAVSLVNYGLAASLITHLSELDPAILSRYYELHGRFHDAPIDEYYFEQIVKYEFRLLNSEYCFISHYGDRPANCQPRPYALTFKPGRTIKILYDERLKYEDCHGGAQRVLYTGDDSQLIFWSKVFARPGNLLGRAEASQFLNGQLKSCEMFKNLENKLEINRFRNFYLDLRQHGVSVDQLDRLYRDKRELFRIGERDRYYQWDSEKRVLRFELQDFNLNYSIPYQS